MSTPDINKILKARPVQQRYGAPLGAKCHLLAPENKMYVQRVQMVDGDYSWDGTYWGGYPSPPLYCAFDVEGQNRLYYRGKTRKEAIATIKDDYPQAQFINP